MWDNEGHGRTTKEGNSMRDTINQVTELNGCLPSDYKGITFRQLLEDAERNFSEVVVYWGCWTEKQLNTVI